MEDLAALAKTLAGGIGDARGSLILSRDGLVLGAHPDEAESLLKPAWLRMASLGEPERGFVQFGAETWCYVRRGAYAAFVIVGAAVRPGIAIDQMEQALLAAEEARARREGIRSQESASPPAAAPTSKPRTPLHPDPRPADRPVVIRAEPTPNAVSAAESSATASEVSGTPASVGASAGATSPGDAAGGSSEPGSGEETSPDAPPVATPPPDAVEQGDGAWVSASDGEGDEQDEVDRFSLAREFSQLLQEDSDRADG